MSRDLYADTFRRARQQAAGLRPEFEDREAAARAIGISDRYLKSLENGEKRPSFEILEAMAKAYGCLVGDLFPSSSPKGHDADRVLGPLYLLPEPVRNTFISQISAMARTLAASMNMANEGMFRAVYEGIPQMEQGRETPSGVHSNEAERLTNHLLTAQNGEPNAGDAMESRRRGENHDK